MTTLKTLEQAILERKPISYEYPKEAAGERIGNPHAIYIFTSEDGKVSTKVHIVQTSGASKSRVPFPSFRTHNLDEIVNANILKKRNPFAIHPLYKPNSSMYKNIIAKV